MQEHGLVNLGRQKDKTLIQAQRKHWMDRGGLTALVRDILRNQIQATDFQAMEKTYSQKVTLLKLQALAKNLKGVP